MSTAITRVLAAKEALEAKEIELGKALAELKRENGLFKGIVEEIGIPYRRAMYLIELADKK